MLKFLGFLLSKADKIWEWFVKLKRRKYESGVEKDVRDRNTDSLNKRLSKIERKREARRDGS